MTFKLPPKLKNEEDEKRKAGFEFEFGGIELNDAAQIVERVFGGCRVEESRFLQKVKDTQVGDFKIEIDVSLLKNKEYETVLEKLGINIDELVDRKDLEDFLAKAASTIIPYEIAAPPIEVDALRIMEELREGLLKKKAQGTKSSLIYAFGLHINPETPSTDINYVLNALRAFFLLYDWIFVESKIDFSRRMTPFINEFPDEYILLVLDPTYTPDMKRLITDYIEYNPTRNRPLDMLPLLSHIDQTLPERLVDELVSPRPAFHYRLPNCLIDDPAWRVATEWNYWVEVEKLAEDKEKIRKMSELFLEKKRSTFISFRDKWHNEVKEWI